MHNDSKCTVPLVVQHSANVKISWGCFFQNVNIFSISHCWNWNLSLDCWFNKTWHFPDTLENVSNLTFWHFIQEKIWKCGITQCHHDMVNNDCLNLIFQWGGGWVIPGGGPAALLVSERRTRSLVLFPVVRLTSAQSSCYAQSSRVCLPALKRSTSSAFISEGRQRVSDPVPVF